MAKRTRRGPRLLADLAGRIINPVAAKRGFATSDLIAAWPDIIGQRFAGSTRPERITWPPQDPDAPGVLVLKVDGPTAVLIQHELDQVVERVNDFMGYRAVGRVRLVQGPVGPAGAATPGTVEQPTLAEDRQAELDQALSDVEPESELRRALNRLGRGVFDRSG